MSRTYTTLECGCSVSCDGGGGLIPCSFEYDNPNCKSEEYFKEHAVCEKCGECKICYCQCEDDKKQLSWDEYYLKICYAVAENSKCLSRQIGAILVNDKSIVSTGYNGPPRGVIRCDQRWLVDDNIRQYVIDRQVKNPGNDGLSPFEDITKKFYHNHLEGVCPRYVADMGFKSGEGLEWCVAGHAERNALINAARNGIKTKGTKMYMSCGIPCTPCLVEIINAGVEEIIVTKEVYYDISAKYLLERSGLKWRVYND